MLDIRKVVTFYSLYSYKNEIFSLCSLADNSFEIISLENNKRTIILNNEDKTKYKKDLLTFILIFLTLF